ncbi:mechanosensitive ion channel domain-containing protein [Telmatospirillum siberiense]|uniref:Mechanosensitive ion channel protein MscS n=1 Tax=Telmatospirillum siberiense TaxID=382514 RepID=A0A2N3PY06_9PROT|nr:mechanosensitive ion channel domain-containing protein [Telmatospirillum siberiense]PKU25292.1 hypothetical protein CWS72_06750 [Telmatospirillum siberiense]
MRISLIAGMALCLALAAGCPVAAAADGVKGLSLPSVPTVPAAPAKDSVKPAGENEDAALASALEAAQADVRKAAEAGGALPNGATQEELLERDHLLQHLVDTLVRHRDALARLPEVRRRADERQKEAKAWTGFLQQPPYSLLLVDQLREALETASVEIQAATTRKTMIGEESDDAEKRFKAAEVLARQSEERLAVETTVEGRNRQTWLHDLARLRSRAAAEDVSEAQIQAAVASAVESLKRADVDLLKTQLAAARKSVRFTQSDLDGVLAAIDRQRDHLEERAKKLAETTSGVRLEVQRAQEALTAARSQLPGASETPAQHKTRLALLEQMVAWRQFQSDTHAMAVEGIQHLIELQNWERTGWQFRWYLVNGSDGTKLPEVRSILDERISRLESWSRYVDREIALSNGRIGEFELRQKSGQSAEEAEMTARFITAERERAELARTVQQAMENFRRTLSVWRAEFESGAKEWSVRRTAEVVANAGWGIVQAFWNFELFSAEDSLDIDGRKVVATRSITIGKSLGVVLLLLVGYLLSAWALRFIRRLAVGQLGLNAGHTNTVLRWLHFILLSMLFIVALYMANIPLTIFAFLGGALAIGVGFGTQVLLKNMISGVMLLIERPLRVGDMIEVGSVVGTVTNISIRSSTVRTSDGIEILVPNSTFVENNVTNWTYSNAKVRRSVTVGVDYAASPERVSEVLLSVAQEHPSVVTDPPPRVLLEDFGPDAVCFKLQYWIDYALGADGSLIASELRMLIARALAAAGISIPLPQRVVYLKKEEDAAS